jgi:histidyl-tRNA synthetase
VIAQSPAAREKAFSIASDLRSTSVSAMLDVNGRSFKAQMREANREQAAYTYIIGDSELEAGAGALKNMQTGEQEAVAFADIRQKFNS